MLGPRATSFFVLHIAGRDVRCQIRGIVADAEQDPRLSAVQPGHSQEVQTSVFSDSTLLQGISIGINDGKLHYTEIEGISDCPDDGRNSRFLRFLLP